MELFSKCHGIIWLRTSERSLGTNYPEQSQSWSLKTSKNLERSWLCCKKKVWLGTPDIGLVYYNVKFFFKNDQMGPSFQIFLIFRLWSGGVTNLSSSTKLFVVTCKKVVNYAIATNSHTWWGNGFFFFFRKKLKLWFFNILNFSPFSFFRFKCLFLSKFLTVGDGIGIKCLLMLILPYLGNNFISTKWALYPRSATYTQLGYK